LLYIKFSTKDSQCSALILNQANGHGLSLKLWFE